MRDAGPRAAGLGAAGLGAAGLGAAGLGAIGLVAAGVVALTVVAMLSAAPVAADETRRPPRVTGIVVHHGDGPARASIVLERLYPSRTRTLVLFLKGDGARSARSAALTVASLLDDDNGCVHPETAAGDSTCGDGPGDGELSSQVDVAVAAGRVTRRGGKPACALVGGTTARSRLRDLTERRVTVGLVAGQSVGAGLCLAVSLTHLDRPDNNLTQTDRSGFDLRLDVSGRSATRVLGQRLGHTSGTVVPDRLTEAGRTGLLGLALTGATTLRLLLVGLAALALGAALVALGRRWPDRTDESEISE